MKVSLEWLNRYIPDLKASIPELENVFTKLGLKVDSVETTGLPPLEKVVVGEILRYEPHPYADRLTVCTVNVGNQKPIQIVCGAKNHKAGDRVPVALVGAILPGDFKIKKSNLRGVISQGMMCSPTEIGLGSDSKGLLILEGSPEIGTPINQVFPEGDFVFDIEVTPNRGDCLSHIGVARELSAYYDLELKFPEIKNKIEFYSYATETSLIKKLSIETEYCSLYTASYIKGIKVGPSPAWLEKAITAIGLRAVNNVVDITNWVMFEIGQPLHVFDANKLEGSTIIVRQAKQGETLTTLDGKERILDESMMVIADFKKPLALAGIMGGLDAEVVADTVDIILESAYFNPASIRQTAHKLQLSTESSYRFVRNVCPRCLSYAARRVVDLILEITDGQLSGPGTTRGAAPRTDVIIEITPDYIRDRIGFEPTDDEIANTFRRLQFGVDRTSTPWKVTVGTFRSEVTRPIDLVEEFIRLYGTDKIPHSPVVLKYLHRRGDPIAEFNHKATDYLMSEHFDECYHYSLRKKEEVEQLFGEAQMKAVALENPLTAEHTHLRLSLIPGLLDALKYNQNHGNRADRLFETGRVFHGHEAKTYELSSVAFVINTESGARTWLIRESPDFFTVKAIALEITRMAGVKAEKMSFESIQKSSLWQSGHAACAGNLFSDGYQLHIGTIKLKISKKWDMSGTVLAGELLMLPESLSHNKSEKRFKPFSIFPASSKDIALVVEQTIPAEIVRRQLEEIAQSATSDTFFVEGVTLFDVYKGSGLSEDKKSLALSLTFRAQDRTLKDDEVMAAFNRVQRALKEKTTYEVRGIASETNKPKTF